MISRYLYDIDIQKHMPRRAGLINGPGCQMRLQGPRSSVESDLRPQIRPLASFWFLSPDGQSVHGLENPDYKVFVESVSPQTLPVVLFAVVLSRRPRRPNAGCFDY